MTAAIILDTHIYIWARIEPERLSVEEQSIVRGSPMQFVSAATLWEVALLLSSGRISGEGNLFELPVGVELLPVTPTHCEAYSNLPKLRHKDPFDRMLIVQAIKEGFALVSRDRKFAPYRGLGLNLLPNL